MRTYLWTPEQMTENTSRCFTIAPEYVSADRAREMLKLLERVTTYLADLNGCDWIKGEDAGSADMRQRAQGLQALAFSAIRAATGEEA